MAEEAYKIAKKVNIGDIDKNKGAEILEQGKWNISSAKMYIDGN